MRGLLLLALALPGWALSNAVTIHATTAVPAAQIHKVPRYFAKGEVAGFPRPHVDGVAAAAWQADVKNRWPDGSVRFAVIHFQAAVAENGSIVVDFRSSNNACHLGSQAVCEAAALTGPQMLDYRSGAWNAEIEVEADPKGVTTTRAANARTMLAAGHFTYWFRGPLVTSVIVEDAGAARSYDFGWTGAGCTVPYDTCIWADDTTHRSLHPIFVLTFPVDGSGAVKAEYLLANYWTTARQDQRYSLALKTSAGTVETKTGIRGVSGTWWRRTFWDGAPLPGAARTDFNFEYLRYSKVIPPFKKLAVDVPTANVPSQGTHNISSTISFFIDNLNSDYPYACTREGTCGSRLTWYPSTGGRPDRGMYPLWEAHWLYTMRADVFDVVTGNAEFLGSQYHHHRESGTGLANYHGAVPATGMPLSIHAQPLANTSGFGTSGLPAAVGPVSTSMSLWRGWSLDDAHRHSHAQLAYLITGDWYFMQEQSFLAHAIWPWGSPGNTGGTTSWQRRTGWGHLHPAESNHRAMAWHLWNVYRAAFIVPDDDPQSAYLKQNLTEALAVLEGYYDVRNGDYYQPCTTSPYDPTADASKWCYGRHVDAQSVAAFVQSTPLIGASGSEGFGADVRSYSSPWMNTFVRLVFMDMCRSWDLGCGIARSMARSYTLAAETPGADPATHSQYRNPVLLNVFATLAAPVGNLQSDVVIPLTDASMCTQPLPFVILIGSERIHIVAKDGNNLIAGPTLRAGRGFLNTGRSSYTAGTQVNCRRPFLDWAEITARYSGLSGRVVSNTTNMGDSSYSALSCAAGQWSEDFLIGARAAEVFRANCKDTAADGDLSMYSTYSDPRWAFESDRPIHQVRVQAGGGTAMLHYVAPSGGACRVYVGASAPGTSDDAGDALDTPNGRLHSFTASGLSAGTHHYRISCGVVRASGTFVME